MDGRIVAIRQKAMKQGTKGKRREDTRLPKEGPPRQKGTWEARDEKAEPRKRVKEGQSDEDGVGVKGRRRQGHARRKVQEEQVEGRAQGQGRPRAPGEQRAAAPRLPQSAPHRRPRRPSAGPGPGSDRQQSGEGPRRASGGRGGGRFLPSPWERGTEGGVMGVGSRGSQRRQ
nr:translation initiation factor IF-2-like [Macaca fascicularis]